MPTVTNGSLTLACVSLVFWFSPLGGCVPSMPTDSARQRPVGLPSELNAVTDARDSVAQIPDNPFATVEPGTVIDPLSGLNGCWAAYYRLTADGSTPLVPAGTPLLDTYEFYSFDTETGRMRFQIYQQVLYAPDSIFAAVEGRFTILDQSRVSMVWDQVTARDPTTGEVTTLTYTEEDDVHERLFLITLSSDQLRLRDQDSAGAGEAAGDPATIAYQRRVFTRFDCP